MTRRQGTFPVIWSVETVVSDRSSRDLASEADGFASRLYELGILPEGNQQDGRHNQPLQELNSDFPDTPTVCRLRVM